MKGIFCDRFFIEEILFFPRYKKRKCLLFIKQLSMDDIRLFVKDNFSKNIKLFILSIFVILLLFKFIL